MRHANSPPATGIPLSITDKEKQGLSGIIYERTSYQKFKSRPKIQDVTQGCNHTDAFLQKARRRRISLSHPFESKLQATARAILEGARIDFKPEVRIGRSGSRVDFKLSDGLHIECKVDVVRKHQMRLIGQLMTYKFHGAQKLMVLIPDDVHIDDDLRQIIFAIPCDIVTLSEFERHFSKPQCLNPSP